MKKHIIYILIIACISALAVFMYSRISNLSNEIDRLNNNISAITDSLTQYRDDNNRLIAEKHAFQLTQEELEKNIELIKTKNREYITYINTEVGIHDTIQVPTYIMTDSVNPNGGIIKFDRHDIYGKSSRDIAGSMRYSIDNILHTEEVDMSISQNIYLESMIERNTKTGETFVKLITDYPNTIFNSGYGVVVSNSKYYENEIRKTKGLGIAVGPSIGLGYDMSTRKISPNVGVSVTIGWTYTPNIFQF